MANKTTLSKDGFAANRAVLLQMEPDFDSHPEITAAYIGMRIKVRAPLEVLDRTPKGLKPASFRLYGSYRQAALSFQFGSESYATSDLAQLSVFRCVCRLQYTWSKQHKM